MTKIDRQQQHTSWLDWRGEGVEDACGDGKKERGLTMYLSHWHTAPLTVVGGTLTPR